MRKKHGFTPKYIDVQASTATMNRHRHSRCHYKRNSGFTPAGMNNLHIGEPAGRRTPAAATTTSAPGGQTAAAMTSGQTLLRQGPRPHPHSRGEDKLSKPKSRRPGARMAAAISSVTRTSSAATTSALTSARRRHTRARAGQPKNTNAALAARDILGGPPVRAARPRTAAR
jgi:hypothetical protein